MTGARCWAEESMKDTLTDSAEESVKDTLTDSAVSSHCKSSLPSEIETGFLELGFGDGEKACVCVCVCVCVCGVCVWGGGHIYIFRLG